MGSGMRVTEKDFKDAVTQANKALAMSGSNLVLIASSGNYMRRLEYRFVKSTGELSPVVDVIEVGTARECVNKLDFVLLQNRGCVIGGQKPTAAMAATTLSTAINLSGDFHAEVGQLQCQALLVWAKKTGYRPRGVNALSGSKARAFYYRLQKQARRHEVQG